MKSPVTYSENVEEIDKIPAKEIIDLYRNNLQMETGEFFKDIEFVQVLQCKDSGYRFYYPATIFGDANFYEELQKKSFYYNQIHWEHLTAKKYIRQTDSVLEVGCGLGFFLKNLSDSGIQAVGLELNPKAIAVCHEKKLNAINELIEEHSNKNPEKYDVVCAFQVLEHIYDIKSFIDGCCKALKPGGKLIFAVPNNNPYFLKYDKMHTLNLPPHHSGLWNKETFNSLPEFFPVTTTGIYVEPLYNRNVFMQSYLKNTGKEKLIKFYKKIHPGITNRLLAPLRLFFQGKCIVAVYEKK